MIQKAFLLLLFLFISKNILSQKVLQKQWDATAITKVSLQSDDVFKVKLVSDPTSNTIYIDTRIAGEHSESVVVNVIEKNNTLWVTTGYSPFFKAENDKLAAHKFISIEMIVTVPVHVAVAVYSSLASVSASGTFTSVRAELERGSCELINYKGNAILFTKQAGIKVTAANGVTGEAVSTYGAVINQLPSEGKYHIQAESIHGTITLLQTE